MSGWLARLRIVLAALAVMASLGAAGCKGSPTAPSPELRGGAVATFSVGSEVFKVFVTNTTAIDRLNALLERSDAGSIPNGRIRRGPGAASHNAPYGWHLDPQDIEIVDTAIELCDGRPSYVQANVDEYVDVIERYCPWGARLLSLADYR